MLDQAPEHTSPPDALPDTLTPHAMPRRILPVERVGALIEVFLCSGFPTQVLVFAALTQLGMASRTEDGALSSPFIIALALVDMVLVLGLVTMFLRAHHETVSGFLTGDRHPVKEAVLGVGLVPVVFLLVMVVLAIALTVDPSLHNVPVNPFQRMLQTPRDAAVFAVVAMLAGGVREEIQRGFIVRRFEQYLGGGLLGIGLYSVIFGLGHLEQGYAAAIATGALGVFWGFLYRARGSVIAPMVSHAGFNLAQLLKFMVAGR